MDKRFKPTYAMAMLRYQRCDIVKTNKSEHDNFLKIQAVKLMHLQPLLKSRTPCFVMF